MENRVQGLGGMMIMVAESDFLHEIKKTDIVSESKGELTFNAGDQTELAFVSSNHLLDQ
jgi:hypothetical protein